TDLERLWIADVVPGPSAGGRDVEVSDVHIKLMSAHMRDESFGVQGGGERFAAVQELLLDVPRGFAHRERRSRLDALTRHQQYSRPIGECGDLASRGDRERVRIRGLQVGVRGRQGHAFLVGKVADDAHELYI